MVRGGPFKQRCSAMSRMNSKILLSISTVLIVSMNYAASMSTKQMAQRKPHIILIVADDLGWNDVSWNNPYVVTPHLHDLAINGLILNNSYVQPTCTPTRAALMTGIYPFKMGLQKGVIKPPEPMGVPLRLKMLPKFLKDVGYQTHAIGKWHLGFCSKDYTPLERGFDTFYGLYSGASDHYTHKRRFPNQPKRGENPGEFLDLRNNTEPDRTKSGHYSTHLFGSAAEEIVRSRNPADPMFLYLAFQSVHSPLQVPQNYSDIYSYIRNDNRRLYLGMVTALDEAVGRLVATLKRTGHYQNSVIIFTTDNGGPLKHGGSNWPLRGGKATMWEGGIRAPSFIHSPLLPRSGRVTNQLHHVTDWFSTIIDITGGKATKVDGISQWDAFAGISASPRNEMVCNIGDVDDFKAAVRFNDYKMLVGHLDSKKWESPSPSEDKPTGTGAWIIPSSAIENEGINVTEVNEAEIYSNNEHRNMTEVNSPLHERANLQKNTTSVLWGDLKNHTELEWEPEVLKTLEKYLTEQTTFKLFNIKDDPEERNDTSPSEFKKLKIMTDYLSLQLQQMIPAASKIYLNESHPIYWNNVWSPGWCQSQ
ncbi:arylsulfatase B-like [Palaemon carinicauda]|uniref:arylsulfatase B-like n=1 Tax=Palaemon carinicauda TaxID=392227 RepID=UPI0035B5AEF7